MAFIGKLKALCWFVFRDIFRIQLNIHDGFFWRKQFSLILKLLRQKKNCLPASRIWTGWQMDEKDLLCVFFLFLISVATIYCINPSHVILRVLCTYMVSQRVSKSRSCLPEKWPSTLIMGSLNKKAER